MNINAKRYVTGGLILSMQLMLWVAAARSAALNLEGDFSQGGLVFGQATAGSQVHLDDRRLRLADDGRFIFGFGRDHGPTATLTIQYPDGARETRQLDIAKHTYKIQRIDGLPKKMVTPDEKALKRIRRENGEIARLRAVDSDHRGFQTGFVWPAIGIITGVFGSQRILNGEPRRPHYGIDIAAPRGSAVTAPADGIVTMAEDDLYFTGGTILIDHGHGLTSVYSHLSAITVKVAQAVRQGDEIGQVGSTGRSTGPHLDWRINWFDQRLDPARLAGPMPK